jgi:hypothetical protein
MGAASLADEDVDALGAAFPRRASCDRRSEASRASVIDIWADIQDWNGTLREKIAPGAFKEHAGSR